MDYLNRVSIQGILANRLTEHTCDDKENMVDEVIT